jgi:putative FmdB family regulatory protein
MPIYEYICRSCEEKFSLLQRVNSPEGEARCPRCSSHDVKKVMSSFSCSAGGGGGCAPSVPSGGFSGGG